ncbi:MAG: ATP synthase F1 subunit epsilon [Planctomycetaceae bacterium]|nr:ATP synthase F1 subunit epsilon [Planctomycetaceae bacterium]
MKCIVVTPETTLLDVEATFVALPLFDGEIGIGKGHTPLVGRLGFGEMRVTNDKQTESYFVEGGFVEVLDGNVTLMTNNAVPSEELDIGEARTELESALKKSAQTEDQLDLREMTVAAARARLRLAEKRHGGK